MTSSSVSDSAAPVVAGLPPEAPALPDQPGKKTGQFGAMLKEAATNKQQAKCEATETDDSDEKDSDVAESGDGKGKKKTDANADAIPLICFCPPPNIQLPEPVKAPEGESKATDSESGQLANVSGAESQVAAETTPAPAVAVCPQALPPSAAPDNLANQEAVAGSVVKMVESKAAPTLSSPNPPKTSRVAKSSGAIELDRKLFEPVLPEPVALPDLAKSVLPKSVQPPASSVANTSHGTLVAKLENNVKNTDKSAEIAPAIEQKMPSREVLRRAVDELSRVESFQADKQSSHLLIPDFDAAPAETIPVKSQEAANLVESIRTEVASLRQRGDNMVTVVLRPDSGTQLSVDISVARDGSVHAVARCERGDFQSLQTQWPQLQQSLAAHGIRVADLSSQNGAQQQNQRSAGAFQNFDHGENNSKQRDHRDAPNFEEQFAISKTKVSANKTQPQPARTASATRRWQSWA